MKSTEIQVNGYYRAKVSGVMTTLRVDSINVDEVRKHGGYTLDGVAKPYKMGKQTSYSCTNMHTGRTVTVRSAAKFKNETTYSDPSTKTPEAPLETTETPMPQTTQEVAKNSLASRLQGVKAKNALPIPSHIIVDAKAGTGKTTTLIDGLFPLFGKVSKLKPSVEQLAVWKALEESKGISTIAMVAFNKSIAVELQSRVPQGVNAMTMHSMGNSAVKNAYQLKSRNVVNGWKVKNIIEEFTGKKWKELDPTFLSSTEKLVGLSKLNLEHGSKDELDGLTAKYDVATNGQVRQIYDMVPRVLERCMDPYKDNCIDYNDMVWLPIVNNLPIFQYDLLLVDESQDLGPCQQELAIRAGRRLIFCGDPNQAIYGFAGADSQSLNTLAQRLKATPEGCITLPLTVTRRCSKAVVREAQKLVPNFYAHEDNLEGAVKCAPYKTGPARVYVTSEDGTFNDKEMKAIDVINWLKETKASDDAVEKAYSYLKNFVLGATRQFPGFTLRVEQSGYRKLVRPGDIVISRINAPLVRECFVFLKERIPAVIQGRDVGAGLTSLIKKLGGSTIEQFQTNLQEWFERETLKENSKKNPKESYLILLSDKYDCLMLFSEECKSIDEMLLSIKSMFDDASTGNAVLLSSIHKVKGLEATTVYFLVGDVAPVPHPMAKTPQAIEQEYNLLYVGITRAIDTLVYVSNSEEFICPTK